MQAFSLSLIKGRLGSDQERREIQTSPERKRARGRSSARPEGPGRRTPPPRRSVACVPGPDTLTAKARSQVASSVSNDIAERMDGGGAHQDIKRAEPRDGSFYRRAGEIGLTRVAVKAHYDLLFICREEIGDGEGVLRIADDGDLVDASGQERRRRKADARTSAQYERVLPSNSLSREGKVICRAEVWTL